MLSPMAPRVHAIAYARVDSAKPEWITSPHEDEAQWAAQCTSWAADLALLAEEIAAGLARAAPKRGGQTCRLCEFDLMCRIREFARLDDDEEEDQGVADYAHD